MVNYVLSFCKITGASKIFKRNFYLPLLKPLTPKEALRTLRITGKWLLGAKIQHYIPVLLNHRQKRSKRSKNYGKKTHEDMDDFTYMTPVLDVENESHKILLKLLEGKDKKGVFVYTVADKKYNIVLQAHFEVAIRNGDIIDLLVSQKNDKIIVKLKDFKKIPMEIQYYEGEEPLFCGEGATSPEEEKFHHHGKYTMSLAKIFEDKELIEEKWEEELKKIMKRKKKQRGEGTKAWREMVKQSIKNLDWKKFEEDAKKVIEEIDEPVTENPIAMEIDDLEATKNVNETLLNREELLNQLPTLKEIPDIIKSMPNASLTEIEDGNDDDNSEKRRVSGVKVKLSSGKECFVSGQMVHTEEGDVFVPGQTINSEYGLEYAPGITINIDNKPTLISGLIMGEEERDPMFLPTQSTITADGQLTFATTPEERPPPQPEANRLKRKKIVEEVVEEEPLEMILVEFELDEDDKSSEEDDKSCEEDEKSNATSIELNNSEMEELDMEAIRLKHEQQRLEIEKLKQILLDDGMDEIIANLEDKKAKLKQKLEELRKLSMNAEDNLITYINDSDAFEVASKISQDQDTINRITDILLTMTRRLATFRDRNNIRQENINNPNILVANASEFDEKFNKCSNKLKILFKTAVVAANDVFKNRPKDQLLALNAIGEIVTEALGNDGKLLEELLDLMETSLERNEVCLAVFKQLTYYVTETKVGLLGVIRGKTLSPQDIFDNIAKILDNEQLIACSFKKLAKVDPEIVKLLIDKLQQHSNIKTDDEAVEILQKCIVDATRDLMDKNLALLAGAKEQNIVELVEEALSFAKALSLDEVVENLSHRNNLNNCEISTMEMLKRMTIIRQLAERDYSLKTAIVRIKKNPECAKSDPRIRQLIRESAVVISNVTSLKTSRDIPLALMKKQNPLALEDYLMQHTKLEFPVLVTRSNLEAVVPKEAARGVLAGRVAYVLIDESGVNYFKPMHMMAAVKVNQNRERRIDDYLSVNKRDRSREPDDNRTYLQAKNNGADDSWSNPRSRGTMSSGALSRGYTGPRA